MINERLCPCRGNERETTQPNDKVGGSHHWRCRWGSSASEGGLRVDLKA
jgi:hypothetical protein